MFIGHFAVGFASKRLAPKTSLAWLIAAPLFLDLLFPLFLALGIETVRVDKGNTAFTPLDLSDIPWSHSLAMTVVWMLAFAGVYWVATRDRRGALVLALGVLSHFVLDWVTHKPNTMELWPGADKTLGLGLWNSLWGTIVIEGAMFVAGVAIYVHMTRPRRSSGSYNLWGLVALLLTVYVTNLVGPPPPSANAIMGLAFLFWPTVLWVWAMDRAREVTA